MTHRISFFVSTANQSPGGRQLTGEVGLGPIELGDAFTLVHHIDSGSDEPVSLSVVELNEPSLRVSGSAEAEIRSGDILLAEIEG